MMDSYRLCLGNRSGLFGGFGFVSDTGGSVLHWTRCCCLGVAVRGQPAEASSPSTTWESFSSGLAAGAFTHWANSPAPEYVFLIGRWGLGQTLTLLHIQAASAPSASDSQVLKLQVATTPSLMAVISYVPNVATSHGPAHGLWLACLLRCKMKRHTGSKARSSRYSSCCQGQQEKQEMLQ